MDKLTPIKPGDLLRVLLIDDSTIVRKRVQSFLDEADFSENRFELHHADCLASGIMQLQQTPTDVLLLDMGLPDASGLESLERVRELYPRLPVIILTGSRDNEIAAKAIELGAQDFLTKAHISQGIVLRRSIRHAYDREQMLTRMREQSDELEQRNRELEAFSDSVAHDLRSPLTILRGYADLIPLQVQKERYDDILDSAQDLNRVITRMNDIIGTLLDFSRSEKLEIARETLDLSALSRDIAGDLGNYYSDHDVQFGVSAGMTAEADRRLMNIVLTNLLGNAWKYTQKAEHPFVKAGISHHEGKTVFYIRDNGIGFDMDQVGDLFAPFKRLHADKTFTGIGIGLTTVKRIIERHGGTIWAESEPGKSTTFYFTLD